MWYSIYSTKNSESPLVWNTATLYCKCDVCVDEPAGSFTHGQSMHKNINYNALHFIGNKWPLTSFPSFFFSPPIPLCLPLSGFIFQNTINHVPVHPEILTAVSSVLLLNGYMCAICVHFVILEVVILCVCVFWMRTWLNLCKMMVFLCRVLQKTLSKLERACENRWNVLKVLRNVSLFQELY